MYSYNHTLIIDGSKMCAIAWGTGLLCPDEMIGYMSNIFLPTQTKEETVALQEILDKEHNVYIVTGKVKMHSGEERFFTRLSAQVYLTMDDFIHVCELVPLVLDKIRSKKFYVEQDQPV